ncbi:CmcJ/NvfI family oxidoreductase [Aurantiacibacter sp. MUD11]|uniref:CmcJ/NvfI family oxidoreductase n=1 Tax=Aurantiacibacter sp. MUD11 TaxID=3003265 RepID=UPI0022AA0C3D|nr:CmcJ/NvfI family oxidoreductase [Aurantiacibacter sp. MUD11]WAT18127.1 CmcJ/NvfI family oxidoreductase [Aurantiacibacter sp. MUD11]
MATQVKSSIEDDARQVRAMMRYVDEGDFVTRRYVSQGKELNTGTYSDHEVIIRDGMPIRDHFTLDTHGFMIARSASAVTDFYDRATVERLYEREVEADVVRLTGADKCAARGWMLRTSADLTEHASKKSEGYTHHGGLQPPAGEAHVDTAPRTAERMARQTYEQCFPDGPGFKRFLITSHWRTFSPPPQDIPLALCDGRTSFGGEEKDNTLLIVDEFPEGDALTAPVPGEEDMLAATIFSYHPSHRWWYFAGMERDDVLLFKFYDSDHERTWRCPHSAFVDGSAKAPNVRESIECRSVAFWE